MNALNKMVWFCLNPLVVALFMMAIGIAVHMVVRHKVYQVKSVRFMV